jgi:uncharacterized protein (DUF1499 family)
MRLSRIAVVLAAVAVLLMPAGGLGFRVGLIPMPYALLTTMRWAAYLGLAALVLSIVAIVLAYRRQQRMPVVVAGAGLVLALVAVVVPMRWALIARRVPPIHDITTDLANPPTFQAVVPLRADADNTLEYSAEVGQQQQRGYPDIAPVTLFMPPEAAFERALITAQNAGWTIVNADRAAGRIEATDTTFWFGFKDDIVVRLTPGPSGTRIDVRSVSRIGRSDVGTNAQRVRQYLASLQAS